MKLLLAALLLLSPANSLSGLDDGFIPGAAPTMDLSAVRMIDCLEGYGSGFMNKDGTVVTALHVAEMTKCTDRETGSPLKTVYEDPYRDFAMMKGNLPLIPYMHIDCGGYVKGHDYYAIGYSGYRQPHIIFRFMHLVASGMHTDETFIVSGAGEDKPMPGMMHLSGYIVPGTSGGYIGDLEGNAVGIVNVGVHSFNGLLTGDSFSYELKNTILCKPPKDH